ncbi:hypothetical protein STIAU_4320 [Stigmatella aurantiaca DW4/3-1]|uniref:Uncharacterized protein n=1 Tax=Stigmatella aurantiaca (strain DW4/3-1) TaxID=378806 RepID=Q090I1_STIAD|nr:hypothetical protein STIAU_4320 [Stigmatella aurantiaca DW4/3-1]
MQGLEGRASVQRDACLEALKLQIGLEFFSLEIRLLGVPGLAGGGDGRALCGGKVCGGLGTGDEHGPLQVARHLLFPGRGVALGEQLFVQHHGELGFLLGVKREARDLLDVLLQGNAQLRGQLRDERRLAELLSKGFQGRQCGHGGTWCSLDRPEGSPVTAFPDPTVFRKPLRVAEAPLPDSGLPPGQDERSRLYGRTLFLEHLFQVHVRSHVALGFAQARSPVAPV